jgi:hypothetical protein
MDLWIEDKRTEKDVLQVGEERSRTIEADARSSVHMYVSTENGYEVHLRFEHKDIIEIYDAHIKEIARLDKLRDERVKRKVTEVLVGDENANT